MDVIVYLIPIALFLGLLGLAAFLWSLKSGQFDDLDGAAHRVLFDDEDAEEPAADAGKDAASSESRKEPRDGDT